MNAQVCEEDSTSQLLQRFAALLIGKYFFHPEQGVNWFEMMLIRCIVFIISLVRPTLFELFAFTTIQFFLLTYAVSNIF